MSDSLTFGVFPFGLAGGPDGLAAGPPDDFAQIRLLLRILQGDGPPILTRAYVGWAGASTTAAAPAQVAGLIAAGLHWDLVLAYRDPRADIRGWTDFVAQVVTRYGADLAAVQVTGEANLTGIPDVGDGAYAGAIQALVHGITAAADAKQRCALDVPVGFAVVPESGPVAGTFWPAVAALGGARFPACLDYVGLDMYPDVFGGRIEPAGLGPAVGELLRTVHARRREFNVTHWELR